MIVGYTSGVFDMFHIGHLKILEKAKSHCDHLIVGVSTDELVQREKDVRLIIPYSERASIVEAIRHVDLVVPQDTYDKMIAWESFQFDRMFVGDDWKGSQRWGELEIKFKPLGVDIIYLPYTRDISSSKLREIVELNYHIMKRP